MYLICNYLVHKNESKDHTSIGVERNIIQIILVLLLFNQENIQI